MNQVNFWVTKNLDFVLRSLRRHRPGCILTNAPPVTPTGIPCLQSLLRTLVLDKTGINDKDPSRLLDSDKAWFLWSVTGFCIFLGSMMDSDGAREFQDFNDNLPLDQHPVLSKNPWFIRQFLRWISHAIEFLDTMLDGGRLPPTGQDGCVRPVRLCQLPRMERDGAPNPGNMEEA